MKYNFREISSKDLSFGKKSKETRLFPGNKIVKFKPSNILLASMASLSIYFFY